MSKSTTTHLGLDRMVQRKGEATRPVEMPQRGELAPPPVAAAVQPAVEKAPEEKKKVQTVRLPVSKWRRLKNYAFRVDMSHQQVIDAAITRFLDEEGEPN